MYSPPEWHNGCIYKAEPTSVFSLGVILFEILTGGLLPFNTPKEMKKANLKIPAPLIENYSIDCLKLLVSCLKLDQADRPTFKEIADHSWVKN